jgi:uncharacterized protein (TIGR03089 family)
MGGFAGQIGITVPSHFAALVDADPSLPWLTHYDDASGERTELSGATLANWVAKTANLLVDGLGLSHGDRVSTWLPPHWQSAAVLLGAWTAGLTVAYAEPTAEGSDVEFASLEAVEAGAPEGTADRFVLGLAPMGMPLTETPAGWADYVAAVRQHGDVFSGPAVDASAPAMIDPTGQPVTHGDLLARAANRASELGIAPSTRVVIDADAHPYPLEWLLAPLSVGSTIVLSTHTDLRKLAARAEAEKATLVAPSLP